MKFNESSVQVLVGFSVGGCSCGVGGGSVLGAVGGFAWWFLEVDRLWISRYVV